MIKIFETGSVEFTIESGGYDLDKISFADRKKHCQFVKEFLRSRGMKVE